MNLRASARRPSWRSHSAAHRAPHSSTIMRVTNRPRPPQPIRAIRTCPPGGGVAETRLRLAAARPAADPRNDLLVDGLMVDSIGRAVLE